MTDDEADALLDAQLRDVAVPTDLAERLRRLAQWPDDEVDRGLTDVGVPVLLSSRLKSISLDAELDEQLRDVSPPLGLRARLRKIAARSQAWRSAAVRSLAASLLLAVTLGYGAFAWQVLFGARDGQSLTETTFVVMRPMGVELEAGQGEFELFSSPYVAGPPAESGPELLVSASPAVSQLPARDLRSLTPIEAIFNAAQTGSLDRRLTPRVLGAPLQDDLPQLALVSLPQARGVMTPIVPGYNRGFLLRSGIHPPVVTGLNPALQQSLAPLSVSTESFDEVRELLVTKRRIPADEVRTEDFIAAVEHDLPEPSPGELSLSTVGSVSAFGPDPTRLLGLGVRAGEAASRLRESTHLVIAVDFSAGLARSNHWPWLREALLESVARLSANDRISLVFYQDEVLMASSPLQRKDASLLRQRLANAYPQGEVDPAIGLEAALDVALAAETPAKTRRIAVLTDGHFELAAPHYKRLEKVATHARSAGIDLDVLQLGGGRSVAQGAGAMSRTMRVELLNFDTRRSLVHGAMNLLHGDEAIAASEVKLVVRFLPDAVASYRLVGHEANAMTQLSPPAQVVELRSGDEALVLFELLPTGNPAQTVAEAELTWLSPKASERRSLRRVVSWSEINQPWNAMPTAFRAATIAAEAAEQLRGSRAALRELKWFGSDRSDFDDLRNHARALQQSADAGSLKPLLSLLEAAAHRRP
jgi:hypothetical protein